MNSTNAMKTIQYELHCQRSEEDSEDFFGHQHAALIEMVADAVGPPKYGDIQGQNDSEQDQHQAEHRKRVRLG